jgi:hypothetical protein
MGQPRRNENRFYRYPMRRVSAIIDDDAGLQAALDALPQTGVDVSKVHVLTGQVGARLLDRRGTGHGLPARLLRLAQWGAYEGNALEAHERALKNGHNVIFVPAGSAAPTSVHGSSRFFAPPADTTSCTSARGASRCCRSSDALGSANTPADTPIGRFSGRQRRRRGAAGGDPVRQWRRVGGRLRRRTAPR